MNKETLAVLASLAAALSPEVTTKSKMPANYTSEDLRLGNAVPEFYDYSPTAYAWEMAFMLPFFKVFAAPINYQRSGSTTIAVSAVPGFPLLVAALVNVLTPNANELQGNITFNFTKTYWDASTEVETWDGSWQCSSREGANNAELCHIFGRQQKIYNSSSGTIQNKATWVPYPVILADAVTDPGLDSYAPCDQLDIQIVTSSTIVQNSVELITPLTERWARIMNVFMMNNIAAVIEAMQDRPIDL